MFTQNKNENSLKFEFEEDGLNFTLKDKSILKTEFISFEDITNKSHEFFEKNEGHKSRAIYFLIVGMLFLVSNIILKTRLWSWMFLVGAPIFYFLYKKSIVNFIVLNTETEMDIWVLEDKNQKKIIDEIYSRRNDYLIKTYLEINYNNESSSEINKFSWLKKLEIINKKEFEVIKEDILNHKIKN